MITGKIWGTTEVLLQTPTLEVHRLFIKPNMRCSLHMHRFKHNAFYVRTGQLYIDVHKNDYDLVDTTWLKEGDFTSVKPGEYHLFRSGPSDVQAIELYHLEPLSEDIVRKDCGGLIER
jgi:mannose-6-phosphate isomerase-like protein (cupin superfamily)